MLALAAMLCVGHAWAWQDADVQDRDVRTLNPQAQTPDDAGLPVKMRVEEIVSTLVQQNRNRAQALGAYQGTRIYHLEYRGFSGSRSAEMVVDVKYHAPGTKEFTIRSETGSKLIIERVFKRMLQSEKDSLTEENQKHVALNNDNYSFTLVGFESLATGFAYILSVEPRTSNKLLYRGRIWVDADDFAVVRIEAVPAKNPSFWTKETRIHQVYAKVGEFWLPLSNRSNSLIRLGGRADFTIDYQNYQITAAKAVGKSRKATGY